jgi:23S rRNA pseudouridine1911/1915/1917 synthase
MQILVNPQATDQRLDLFLTESCPELSRSRLQGLIKDGSIRVNGGQVRPAYLVCVGDRIEMEIPAARPLEVVAEDLPLDILYQDREILVVNKAVGMTVHPAPGVWNGTLVNALLYHCKDLSGINGVLRPGIVHRLDKGTSGLLVVAKTDVAHRCLAAQLEEHRIERHYSTLIWGHLPQKQGQIEAAIGRHPKERKKMAVVKDGRAALTHYTVAAEYAFVSRLELRLATGRTHQIRVHLQHLGHPVFGDPVYGGRNQVRGIQPDYRPLAKNLLGRIERQALHAQQLRFSHPETQEMMTFEAPLPVDLAGVVEVLEAERI